MKAKDIMTRDVITVRPNTTVEDIAHLLTKHRIGGVPVVDDERRVVGIVTERDLFLKENGIPFSAVKLPKLFKEWVDPGKLVEIYANARHHKAVEVMTPNPIFVGPEDEVDLIAWIMARYDLKRVPVLEDVAARVLIGGVAGRTAAHEIAHVVADDVHDHVHAARMGRLHEALQVGKPAEVGRDGLEVARRVAVILGVGVQRHRRQPDGRHPQRLQVVELLL